MEAMCGADDPKQCEPYADLPRNRKYLIILGDRGLEADPLGSFAMMLSEKARLFENRRGASSVLALRM